MRLVLVSILVGAQAFSACVECAEGDIQQDGRCIHPCNSHGDCAADQRCEAGACEVGERPVNTGGSSSVMMARTSSSVSSSMMASSSSRAASSSSAEPSSSVLVSSSSSTESSSAEASSSSSDSSSSSAASSSATYLLVDRMDSNELNPAWQLWRFEFSVENERLQVVSAPRTGFNYGHSGNGRGALAVTHVGDPAWTNYAVEMDVWSFPHGAYDPYATGCFRGFSVDFRVKERTESWNDPKSTYYVFGVHTETCSGWSVKGQWAFSRVDDFYIPGTGWSPTQMGTTAQLGDGSGAPVNDDPNGPNHVRISAVDGEFIVELNGIVVTDVADGIPIPYGGIGVEWGWESLGWVDNVVVEAL